MKIEEKEVRHIASLAKLEFKDDEVKAMQKDLSQIIDFVDKLSEVDTENVEPLVYMLDEYASLREDKVDNSISQKEALKNAPQKDSDYIKVARVLDK